MVELLHAKRWEKRNITTFTEGLLRCALVVYNMGLLKHFGKENYIWIFESDFFIQNVLKHINQFSIKKYT